MPTARRASALVLLLALVACAPEPAQPRPAAAAAPAAAAPAPDHFAADLSAAANMGFVDDLPGDGRGGWSDQGRDNSFPDFPLERRDFAGVPFRVIDPAANGGRAVLSMRHPQQFAAAPAAASLPLPAGARGRYLYLLHAACFGPAAGAEVGSVAVGGTVRTVVGGRDLGDWWNPAPLANGALAVERPNGSALVGMYVSRFDLGAELAASRIDLASTGAALWIVVGATLSARDLPLPERRGLTIAAGAEWRAPAESGLFVQAGSALDLSDLVDHAPAGSLGRVLARPDGALVCADRRERPLRLVGCSYDFRELPRDQAGLDALAEATRRQGYNLVRFHFLDAWLAKAYARWGAKADPAALAEFDRRAEAGDPPFDPEALDVFERLVAALKPRGIYIYVDAMTSWTGYYPVNPWWPGNGAPDVANGLLCPDSAARRHWAACVRALFTRTNPHTGTRLIDDPQVVAVLGFNELPAHWRKGGPPEALLEPWRAFLAGRFADAGAWRAAWGHGAPAAATLAEAPLFAVADLWHDRRRALVGEFLNRLEEDTARWMEEQLRGWGYAGIFTLYDWLYHNRLSLSRARTGAVSMHGYFAHPSDNAAPGSTVVQRSTLADALGWWRGIASARIAGLPLMVTEYGQVFWNRHRYEEGLAVGAYAALQDMSLLVAHSGPVQARQGRIGPFNVGRDPVGRAGQVVSALAFAGRAVATAPHRVDLALTRAQALARPDRAISGEQTRLGLVTGLAVAVEGRAAAVPAALTLPLDDGATTIDSRFWSSVVEGGGAGFEPALAALRRAGAVPPGNRTDHAAQVYESATGELLLEARARRLTVAAPTLAGAAAPAWDPVVVAGALTVAADVPAACTAAARDGLPLPRSARILLVLATDARNSGARYRDQDGAMLEEQGGLPVLLRSARFDLALRREPGAPALRAWALALDGSRRDEVAVEAGGGGIRLRVDTGALPSGATPFVELAER